MTNSNPNSNINSLPTNGTSFGAASVGRKRRFRFIPTSIQATDVPPVPTNLQAGDIIDPDFSTGIQPQGFIYAQWDPGTGGLPENQATAYVVEWRMNYTGGFKFEWREILTTVPSVLISVGNEYEGQFFDLRVKAVNEFGESTYTIEVACASQVVQPTNLTVVNKGSEVYVSFVDKSEWAVWYEVQRSVNGGSFSSLGYTTYDSTPADIDSVVTYTDTTISSGNTYRYRVRGVNYSTVWSSWLTQSGSTSVGCTANMEPDVVTGLVATASGSTTINLSWDADSTASPNQAQAYDVWRSADGNAPWTQIATVAATTLTYSDTSLSGGTTRYYRVNAVNCYDSANPSSNANATTAAGVVPNAPSNVFVNLAFATNASLRVAWEDNSGNETGFEIDRRIADDQQQQFGSWSNIATVGANTTSYTNTGLTEASLYDYRVRAVNATGNSAYGTGNSTSCWTRPNAPSNFTVTSSTSSSVSLSWTDNSTRNTDYLLQYKLSGNSFWTSATAPGADATSATISGLTPDRTYNFRIAAERGAAAQSSLIETSGSTLAAIPAPPTAPTGVSASASTTAVAVTVTWTDASSDENGFYIYRNTSNTTTGATLLNSTGPGVQSYTDNATNSGASAPAAGTTYYYWVSSFKSFDESTKTAASQNSSGGVSTLGIPAAPTGFTATSSFADSVSLAWTDASSTETGFDIEVSTNAGSTYSSVTTTAANAVSYSHTGRTESTAYLYRIRATNAAGSSSWVTASSVTTPAAVQSFTATAASSTQINLSWTDKSGVETGFRIERSTDNTNWSLVTTTAASATSFSNTGLTASTLYYYRIRSDSYNGTNNSAWYSANATTQSGSLSPSWTLDFSSGTPSGYTLTRASSGTYVDSSGYIASASTNVARLTHNSSGSRLGLLVEASRTNIALATENFTDTGRWFATNATAADTTNTAPDNGADAESITEVAATSNSYRIRSGAITTGVASGDNFTASCFIKNAPTNGKGYGYVSVTIDGGTSRTYTVIVNLSTGALETTMTSGSPTGTAYTIENYGNGWYRVSATATAHTGATGVRVLIGMWQSGATNLNGYPTYTVTAGNEKSILAWGAQIEEGATPTSYIPTTNAASIRPEEFVSLLDSLVTSWGDPGALVVHFYPPGQAGTIISTDDGANTQLGIEASSTTAARAFWSSGSTSPGTIGTSGVQKAVHYWNGTNSRFSINGSSVVSGTNDITSFGAIDFLTLGAEATDFGGLPSVYSKFANVIIRKVEWRAGTWTDAQLQEMTQ